MQFHVNGFHPGDPDVFPAAPGHRQPGGPLPATVDVLIAGSGPAGLCLAAQLARVPQIRTMLVEPKLGPMEKGQADGISVRSMEMFQAFGFAGKVMRESVWINETTFWAPGEQAPLTRVARVQDLARKHRVAPDRLAAHRDALAVELEALADADARLQRLDRDIASALSAWSEAAGALTASRREAGDALARAVELVEEDPLRVTKQGSTVGDDQREADTDDH